MSISTLNSVFRSFATLVACAFCSVLTTQCSDETEIQRRPPPPEVTALTGVHTFDHSEVGTVIVGGVLCSATLIATDVVITSSQCVGYTSHDTVGNWGRFFITRGPDEQVLSYVIDRYVSSPSSAPEDDIALLHLESTVAPAVARPTCISPTDASAQAPLTMLAYGCARRDRASNRGAKLRFDFDDGHNTSNLCPGDTGGPVMLRGNGAIVRLNRTFAGEAGTRDSFASATLNRDALLAKVREWGSVPATCSTNEAFPSDRLLNPPVETPTACGRFEGVDLYTCVDRTEMVRCVNGVLEQVSCPTGCITRASHLNDVCAPARNAPTCNDWAAPTLFTCNIGRTERALCIRGQRINESCYHVCNPSIHEGDGVCADEGQPPPPPPPPPPPVMDSGVMNPMDVPTGRPDTFVPRVDSYVPPVGDTGVGPIADSGVPEIRPPGDVQWTPWPSQHNRSNAPWGTALTDIIRHLPLSYGDTYADADLVTYGHETTHGINSHARNNLNRTGRRANGFYCMSDRVAIVVEPAIRKSAVAPFIPASVRGTRFALYITGSPDWDDRPLYIFDEWVAYTNGSEVALSLVRENLWRYPWRDAVAGSLEFTIYALATAMAVEAGDPTYFRDNAQFRAFVAWNARRAMDLYRAGASNPNFQYAQQDTMLRNLQTSADTMTMREFARRVFGRPWAHEVLGLDP